DTRQVTLPKLDMAQLQLDPFLALRRWLDTVETTHPNQSFLLCLDEYERIDELVTQVGNRTPLNFLRHVVQHRTRWTVLFAGSHYPRELPTYWSDYLINTQTLRISYLPHTAAVELIKHPIPNFPDIYPDETVEALWQLTNGQPYLIQLICTELVDYLNRQKRRKVTVEDIETIVPIVFERGEQYFREFWYESNNEAARNIMQQVIRDEPVTEDSSDLIEREFLKKEAGGLRFQVPLLARWVETIGR
ncbi:MAG: AAA family ATPase, partial [Candidatus Promineifilaceae bacterium]